MKPPPKGRHKPRRSEKAPHARVQRAQEKSERDLPTRQQAIDAAAQFLADLNAQDPYENTA